MRVPRTILIAAGIILIGVLAIGVLQPSSTLAASGPWAPGTSYPLNIGGPGVSGQPCVASAGYLYCFGGQDSSGGPTSGVYSAALLPSGMGNWTLGTNSYPQAAMFGSCTTYGTDVYCVGGTHDVDGDDLASVYYAPLTPLGPGDWASTTPFPVAVDSQSCFSSSGYMYCAGGNNETAGTNSTSTESNSVWFAPLSASGVDAWARTTAYPQNAFFESCTAAQDVVYCVGGLDGSDNPVTSVYYATLSSNGVGPWTATTAYPVQAVGQACATSPGYIYCVGGISAGNSPTDSAYYAPLSQDGIGAWQQMPEYPTGVETSCVSSSASLYCVGGYEGNSEVASATYFAPLSSLLSASSSK